MAKKNVLSDVDSAAPDEFGHFKHHFSITMELDKHPLMMAMALIATGLVIIYVFNHFFKNGATTPIGAIPATTSSQTGTTDYTVSGVNPLPVVITNPPASTTGTGTITTSSGSTYTITAADMKGKGVLHKIAAKFGISYTALYNANVSVLGPDANHAKFNVGTVLTIPGK